MDLLKRLALRILLVLLASAFSALLFMGLSWWLFWRHAPQGGLFTP